MGQIKLSQDRSSQVVTGQAKSEIFLDPKYFWTQIVFSLLVSLNLWLTISCVQNSLKLNFFFKRKVLDTRLLWPENFSTRDQVDYLIVGYFESSWNLENLELECGPAQPDLFTIFSLCWQYAHFAPIYTWINIGNSKVKCLRYVHLGTIRDQHYIRC